MEVGDNISVTFPKKEEPDLTPKKMQIINLYETDKYAVIKKPAGIAVHPSPGHYDNSLVNGLLYKFDIDDKQADFRPGIVHRLDKDTSGILIVAKDTQARERLSKLFQERKVDKRYLAVAFGKPRFLTKTIDEPIARDKIHRKRMAVSEDGKEAQTEIIVKEVYKRAFLAEINLITGRTHQIRVHFSHINHPLLGDELYGNKASANLFERQALHAYKLSFIDPYTNKLVKVRAPLPNDMKILTQKLRKEQ